MKYKFAVAINCIDGRTQRPVISFVRKRFSVDYVDMITEPGPDKILSENKQKNLIKSIQRKILISVKQHKSKHIIVVGHYDCAGNPVGEKEHRRKIKGAMRVINSWDLKLSVHGIWLDNDWKATFIS